MVEYKSEVTSKPPFTLFVSMDKNEYGNMMLTDRLNITRSRWKSLFETVDEASHAERDFEEMTDKAIRYSSYTYQHSETRRKIT